MSILNITEKELADLVDMKNQGKISEAWNFLGSKGDAYAYLAGAIVADNTASMSPLARLFYEMVRSQWNNTGAGGPDGAAPVSTCHGPPGPGQAQGACGGG